ncbi:hypothetical protein ABW20_dc0105335 [Dactylellina cionopaga]|nr:hypothetical protein ABW20_dc0105335 [Dactylellina cionopaga]
MPPRLVHLVRHAQGHHNVNSQYHIRDPDLTAKGHAQCYKLAATFPYHSNLTRVLCSPLKRTIQTTLESFHPAISRLASNDPGWKIITSPISKENPSLPGYDHLPLLDFSLVESDAPEWPAKQGQFASKAVVTRASKARRYLYDNFGKDEEVVVVSHGGFLDYLTGEWRNHDVSVGTPWGNTDWGSYEIVEEKGEVKLVEVEKRVMEDVEDMEEGGHSGGIERMEVEAT